MYNLRELLGHIMHTYIMMYTGWPRLLCNTLARATDWGFRNLTDLSEFILLARVLLVASIDMAPPPKLLKAPSPNLRSFLLLLSDCSSSYEKYPLVVVLLVLSN